MDASLPLKQTDPGTQTLTANQQSLSPDHPSDGDGEDFFQQIVKWQRATPSCHSPRDTTESFLIVSRL